MEARMRRFEMLVVPAVEPGVQASLRPGAPARTVMLSGMLVVLGAGDAESVTRTVKFTVVSTPTVLTVPEILPLRASSARVAGSAPAEMLQLTGGIPPLDKSSTLYALLPVELGRRVVFISSGCGGEKVKVRAFETPPPRGGLKTVIIADPGEAMLAAGTAPTISKSEGCAVGKSAPFQRTVAPPMKMEPITVRLTP